MRAARRRDGGTRMCLRATARTSLIAPFLSPSLRVLVADLVRRPRLHLIVAALSFSALAASPRVRDGDVRLHVASSLCHLPLLGCLALALEGGRRQLREWKGQKIVHADGTGHDALLELRIASVLQVHRHLSARTGKRK